MKKIPEKFILDEQDLKDAITLFLQEEEDYGDGKYPKYSIEFKVEKAQTPSGMTGGGADPIEKLIFSAVAYKV
jgi:hypothetical protein